MRLPPNGIPPATTRIFLAVAAGATTYRDLREVTGRSNAVINRHLWRLRAAGLVKWTDGRSGTLHVLVKPIPEVLP